MAHLFNIYVLILITLSNPFNIISLMKILKTLSFALLATVLWTGCSSDEDLLETTPTETGSKGAFILNQGNSYSSIESTYSFIDFETNEVAHNLFKQTNGQSLGMGVQDGVVHGSHLYLAMHESNLVWVINPKTNKIVKQIETSSPQGIAASGSYVFVTNNDGFVSRIDTLNFEVKDKIPVGPNPVDMEVRDGSLYVSISDGYNYANGYENGFRIVKIDLANFTKSVDIPVGMNPLSMTQDGKGNIFVVCMGNYGTVPAKVYKIGRDDKPSEFAAASIAGAVADRIYLINAPYGQKATYSVLNSETGKAIDTQFGKVEKDQPIDPISIAIRKTTGEVYVTSSSTLDYATQYTSPGYVYCYDANGNYLRRHDAGVRPYRVVFY